VSFAGFLFAFSTLISWSYYGETGIAYAFGKASVLPYRLIFLVFAFIGAVQSLELVVSFSDALVGLLVIPNMIALIALSGKVSQWTKEYFDDLKSGKIKPTK
jgi:AGCS family alanine or glycine:cation symporter